MRRVALPLVALLLLTGPMAVASQPSDLEDARVELDAVEGRMQAAAVERDALDAELRSLLSQIDEQQAEIRTLQAELAATAAGVARAEAGIGSQQEALDRRAAQVYMNPPVGLLDAVFSARSLREAEDALYFLSAAVQTDADLIAQLDVERERLRLQQARLEVLEGEARSALGRLDLLASDLGAKLARQRELVEQLGQDRGAAEALVARLSEEAKDPAPPSPEPSPDPPLPPDPGREAVIALIVDYFSPMGDHTVEVALCVAEAESGFDPHAVNPYTGAAGVFQFIPSTWESLSEAAGWGGSSVFDAEANVAVAAWTVANVGWGPWPVAESCGA
jgi:peptidoglycan hydrolase CwlO-like protein